MVELPDGFACGHATDPDCWTGVTVLLAPPGSVGAGEVRGGGPGTRESDLLSPFTSTPGPEAMVLAGGSARGLGAADGVADWLRDHGRGFYVYAYLGQAGTRGEALGALDSIRVRSRSR